MNVSVLGQDDILGVRKVNVDLIN